MLDEHRLGNDGTEASGQHNPHDSGDQVYEKDDEIAHRGMISKPENARFWPNLAIRHRHLPRSLVTWAFT